MTNKENSFIWFIVFLVAGIFIGIAMGATIISLRYDSYIRHDQLELKGQVAEIEDDSEVIDGLVKELLSQVEQLKAERQRLRNLQEKLSKGEE